MKGTLIGTDYLQQGDSVKILELNTNAAMYNSGVQHLDLAPLFSMLVANQITELHYIYNEEQSIAPVAAKVNNFIEKLKGLCGSNSITYTEHPVSANAVTIPVVEDAVHKFILRQAYDTSAIIDNTYAADKFEFIKLMSGSSFIPKTYFNGEDNLDVVDLSNTGKPNIIEKARFPYYDGGEYPKVSTLSSQESLASKKQDLANREDHLIQEFIYDEKSKNDGYWTTIRTFDIVFGSTLEVINLGGYNVSAPVNLSFSEDVFTPGTEDLDGRSRVKYITKNSTKRADIVFHVDDESDILLYDGTTTNVSTIDIGATIKTVDFDLTYGLDEAGTNNSEEFRNHEGTLELTNSSLQIVSSSLISTQEQTKDLLMIEVGLENGEVWVDTPTCMYYIESFDSDKTYFEIVNKFVVGDKILTYNSESNTVTKKEITSLNVIYREDVKIHNLDFEPLDYFLVDVGNNDYIIMHNVCNACGSWAPCGDYWCDFSCPPCNSGPVFNPGGK